jgi:hypothetical protein
MRSLGRATIAATAVALCVAACSATNDHLTPATPTASTSPATPATPSPTASGSAEPTIALPPAGGFDYQLGGAYDPPAGTVIVSRDSTDTPAPGLYNICYVNGFQSQPGEADAWEGLLLEDADGPVADEGWPDEYLLDSSTEANRAAIAERMGKVILECAHKGFNAVEFDNLDSYSRSNGALTPEGNLALAALYIAGAHAAGLAVGQKNSVEIATQGAAEGFDFAVSEECGYYEECDGYLNVYAVVLDIEYADSAAYATMCASGSLPAQSVRRDVELTTPKSKDYVFERCP